MTLAADAAPVPGQADMAREKVRVPRLPIIDVARGIALAAMVVYHSAWDLDYLSLAPVDATGSPWWRNFAHLIAASFLALSGVSLVLASRGGFAPRAFLKRLAMIGAAALAVTAATWYATPDRFIFFGILHCIALSSVLALPFLRAPAVLTAACGAVFIALPFYVALPLFDLPALQFVGLGTQWPLTSDYVPLFPWFGPVLLGVAATRAGLSWFATTRAAGWQPRRPFARMLAFAGRHSLAIYLAHQLVLMGLFWSILQLTGPNPAAETIRFQRSCVPSCVGSETGDATITGICRAMCACTARSLKRESLWRTVMDGTVSDETRPQLSRIVRQCRESAMPGSGGPSRPE